MAESFKNQVDALTGFASTEDDALSDWLSSGAKEIINQLPEALKEKCMTATGVGTDSVVDLDGLGEILYVTRKNADSGYYAECRKIPSRYGGLATDSSNMIHYATDTDPVYWIDGDTSGAATLYVKPTPETNQPAILHHIGYPTIAHGDGASGVANFPDEAEYLIVLYASCKALQALMNDKSASLPSDITNLTLPVAPSVPTISAQVVEAFSGAPTYTSPVSPSIGSLTITASLPGALDFGSSAGNLELPTVDAFGTAPVYTPPVSPTKESSATWASYFPNADFPDSDPGVFSITAVAPSTPSSPSISGGSVGAITIDTLPSAPDYTAPVFTSSSTYLTEMEEGTIGASASDIDIEHWFSIAGQLIEDEEDTELAQIHLQKISTFLNAFSQDMQNQLNIFNEGNAVYQAAIQRNLEQARINMQDAQKEADLTLQAAIQDYTLELQRYQAQVSTYQANVSKEVQQYQQKLSRYQLELNNSFQAWQAEENNKQARHQADLGEYQANIQNSLNVFNDANIEYQAGIQHLMKEADFKDSHQSRIIQKFQGDVQRYQAHVSTEVQDYQVELGLKMQQYQTNIQNALNKFNEGNVVYQADIQENIKEADLLDAHEARKLQKYQAEVGTYSAQVNANVQKFGQDLANYNAKIQKHSVDYQWLQGQYQMLKQDYMQGIAILKGGGEPQQGG